MIKENWRLQVAPAGCRRPTDRPARSSPEIAELPNRHGAIPADMATKRISHGSKVTIDHDEIRRRTEARGGKPSTVTRTEGAHGESAMLPIDFPGYSGGGSLEQIT